MLLFNRFDTIWLTGIKRLHIAILYASLVDFLLLASIIVLYTSQSPLSTTLVYLSILDGLHAFSWMLGICVFVAPFSFALLRCSFVTYFMAGLFDFISMGIRLFLTGTSTGTAGIGSMYIVVLWFLVDTLQILLLVMAMSGVKAHKDKILYTIKEVGDKAGVVNAPVEWLKIPDDMEDACSSMRLMALIDVFSSITLIIFFALQLGVDAIFLDLYYAQALHLIIWVFDYTMSEAPDDRTFSTAFMIMLGADLLLCVGTNCYRMFLIFQCYQPGTTSTDCLILAIFSWIVVFIVFVLALIDGLSLFFMARIRESSEELTKDLDNNIAAYFKDRRQPGGNLAVYTGPQIIPRHGYEPSKATAIANTDYRSHKYE